MNKSRPSQNKRQRERLQQERRTQKQARKGEAALRRSQAPGRTAEFDPDLAGIQPRPQPLQDWQKSEDV